MVTPELVQEVRRSWPFIRWDAGAFLTSHEGYPAKLFRGRVQPGLAADALRAGRYLLSGTIRSGQDFAGGLMRSRAPFLGYPGGFAVLVTVGGDKYAHEEHVLKEACGKRGLGVLTLLGFDRPNEPRQAGVISVAGSLSPWDHVGAMLCWWGEIVRGWAGLAGGGARARRLFVAAIPAMRDHHLYRALAGQVLRGCGRPQFALSLLPSLAASITVLECLKAANVPTGGLRSQLTGREIEHIIANPDVLFCKCRYEADFYRGLFPDGSPELRDGCVLSLPAQRQQPPLDLPAAFALVIGTAPFRDQAESDYFEYVDRCFAVAAAAGLPVVYKAHTLARSYDDRWFARQGGPRRDCLRVDDVRRNQELIEHAALVVTAPSTLVYYAILRARPLVLVDFRGVPTAISELVDAPIRCLRADDPVPVKLDWPELQQAARDTRAWFERNYPLEKGPDHVVDSMIDYARRTATGIRPQPQISNEMRAG